VIDGNADVAATFAGLDGAGAVVRGGWSTEEPDEELRVLATFGAIPADLIAMRTDAPTDLRDALALALVSACTDPAMGSIAKRVFGIESFGLGGFQSYDRLRVAIDAAAMSGLLEGTDSQGRLPTRPPGPPA
jgi:ABC-type phosphate/phosphonate transport system substrate-binding protein